MTDWTVIFAAQLAVGDVLLPCGSRYQAAGVHFVEPVFPLGVRVTTVNSRGAVTRTIGSRTKVRIASRLPAAGGMMLYRRAVWHRLVAWYPFFPGVNHGE